MRAVMWPARHRMTVAFRARLTTRTLERCAQRVACVLSAVTVIRRRVICDCDPRFDDVPDHGVPCGLARPDVPAIAVRCLDRSHRRARPASEDETPEPVSRIVARSLRMGMGSNADTRDRPVFPAG